MRFSQSATYSRNLSGTSSSGASLILYGKPWENLSHKRLNASFGIFKSPHSVDLTAQGTEFPENYYSDDFRAQIVNPSHAEADAIFPEPELPQLVGGTSEIKEYISGSYVLNSYIIPQSGVDVVLVHTGTGDYYWKSFQKRMENPSHARASAIFREPRLPQSVGETAQVKENILSSYFRSYMNLLSDADVSLAPAAYTGNYYWHSSQIQIRNLSHARASAIFWRPESPQPAGRRAWVKDDNPLLYLSDSQVTSLSDLSDVAVVLEHVETGTAITDFTELRKSQIEKQKLEMSKQFDILSQREDNWDGRGSQKPTDLTLAHANEVMGTLLDSVISAGHQWDIPSISSDGDGNVTTAWYKNERQLHLQIGKDEAEYFRVWGTNIDTEMDVDFLKSEHYLPLWKWLIDGLPFSLDMGATLHLSPAMEMEM